MRIDRNLRGFSIFVFVLCALNLLINNINHRFFVSDFKVYYFAAQNLLEGGRVYFLAFGLDSGFFKYSPMNLLLFVPYQALNFTVAAVVHFAILSFCYWYTYILIHKLLRKLYFPGIRKEGWLLSYAVLGTLIFLVKELYLGNINIILIMFSIMALDLLQRGKPWLGGLLLGFVVFTKPFFLILILPILLRKEFRVMAGMIIVFIVALIVPFIFLGIDKAYSLTTDWINAVFLHGSDYPSKNSIEYLLRYHFFPEMPSYVDYLIIVMAGLLALVFIFMNLAKERSKPNREVEVQKNIAFEWFLLMAVLPSIVRTDTEHFMASAPVITFIIYYIAFTKRRWLIPVIIILLFFFGGNSQDLLGKELSARLFYMGLIGLSNLLMIAMAFLLYLDFRKRAT